MGSINIAGTDWFFQHTPGPDQAATLVFIHGSGGNHEMWSGQMTQAFNSIALDLPGHGQSGGYPADSIGQSASAVAEFLAQMKLPRPLYLVGHSMGAAITLTLALHHPELLDGIILVGAGQRMRVMPAFLEALRTGQHDPGFFRLAFSPAAPPEIVENMVKTIASVSPAVLYADFSACNDFDLSQELENITKPTLLIVGEDDKMTPLKLSQYIAEHIAGAQLEIIPAAGHFVMLEKPAQVNQLIRDFCS